jgi:hypothetical protein
LARPADALKLLLEHQHDDPTGKPTEPAGKPDESSDQPSETDKPAELADADATPDAAGKPEPTPEPDDHQSLSMAVPPRLNAAAARPPVVLHFHLSEAALPSGHAIVRPEDGGPLTLDQLVEFLGRSRCLVSIQPLLDPTEVAPVDGYEIPARLRAAVKVRRSLMCFPSAPV